MNMRVASLVSLFVVFLASSAASATECPARPSAPPPPPVAGEPANLGELKLKLLDYKCFGDYDRDMAKALSDAQFYIEYRAPQVTLPAIVLDIDETSLSNWREILANDFGFIPEGACSLPKGPCGVGSWDLMAAAEAIAPTVALVRAARAKGVAIFFVTGRRDSPAERAATESNLHNAGYGTWAGLSLRPESSTGPVAAYKAGERARIASQGFTIIANIGDQWSDLTGGNSGQPFKLPNPFYFLP